MLRLGSAKKPLKIVDDQICTPTAAKDLAERVMALIHSDARGLFHMTNSGDCSWHEFAKEIFRLAKIHADISPTNSEAYGAKAVRPAYSVLDNLALRNHGFVDFRPWQEALAEYLQNTNLL
jgi:dTDP-4-dehydrorhamnose reductase